MSPPDIHAPTLPNVHFYAFAYFFQDKVGDQSCPYTAREIIWL